ncbi:hypothetical protein [Marinobacterium lutimaris]|uniref:Uncharacterized protein n=1 Tax=Marinobacterium lutimaris TaxID=568106 RepID=A0A1H5YPF2_9GAMM|nr:hypothetical protein [Marinobacterium lutimaris]SEG25989.1 hypothetical protein SAMN05444390_1011843 [Marinobacterium lutimaris]
MSDKLKHARPPQSLDFPIVVEECFFEPGQYISEGDQLYIFKDSAGRKVIMRSPLTGSVAEGPVAVGSALPKGMPVVGVYTTDSAGTKADTRTAQQAAPEKPATESPVADNGPTSGAGSSDGVSQAVEKARENAPSGFMQKFWSSDKPGVSWGGVGPIFKLVIFYALLVLIFNLALRITFPDLALENRLLPSIGLILLAIWLTLLTASRWRRRPSPIGLYTTLIPLVIAGIFISILPDRELAKATGFRADRLWAFFHQPGNNDAPPVTKSAPSSEPEPPSASAPSRCFVEIVQHCEGAYSSTVKNWSIVKRHESNLPADLCTEGLQALAYTPYSGELSYPSDFPARFKPAVEPMLKRFEQGVKTQHADCAVMPWSSATLKIVPNEELAQIPGGKRKCTSSPQPTASDSVSSYVCARF